MTTHDLKIEPGHFREQVAKRKTYEVRLNDRNFQVGDKLRLREWTPGLGYTGSYRLVLVTHMQTSGHGIIPGWCIMSTKGVSTYRPTTSPPIGSGETKP